MHFQRFVLRSELHVFPFREFNDFVKLEYMYIHVHVFHRRKKHMSKNEKAMTAAAKKIENSVSDYAAFLDGSGAPSDEEIKKMIEDLKQIKHTPAEIRVRNEAEETISELTAEEEKISERLAELSRRYGSFMPKSKEDEYKNLSLRRRQIRNEIEQQCDIIRNCNDSTEADKKRQETFEVLMAGNKEQAATIEKGMQFYKASGNYEEFKKLEKMLFSNTNERTEIVKKYGEPIEYHDPMTEGKRAVLHAIQANTAAKAKYFCDQIRQAVAEAEALTESVYDIEKEYTWATYRRDSYILTAFKSLELRPLYTLKNSLPAEEYLNSIIQN